MDENENEDMVQEEVDFGNENETVEEHEEVLNENEEMVEEKEDFGNENEMVEEFTLGFSEMFLVFETFLKLEFFLDFFIVMSGYIRELVYEYLLM